MSYEKDIVKLDILFWKSSDCNKFLSNKVTSDIVIEEEKNSKGSIIHCEMKI